jgi:hypothetical protein
MANNQNDYSWYIYDVQIWSVTECGIGLVALALCTLSPLVSSIGRRRPKRRDPYERSSFYSRDYASEARLRGLPLESGLGNTSHIEAGCGSSSSKKDRSGLRGIPGFKSLKLKRKEAQSTEHLVRYNSPGPKSGLSINMDDLGILKTTDVHTFSDEDLSLAKAVKPREH